VYLTICHCTLSNYLILTNGLFVLPGLVPAVTSGEVTIGEVALTGDEVTMTGVEDTFGRGDVAFCRGEVELTGGEVALCRDEV